MADYAITRASDATFSVSFNSRGEGRSTNRTGASFSLAWRERFRRIPTKSAAAPTSSAEKPARKLTMTTVLLPESLSLLIEMASPSIDMDMDISKPDSSRASDMSKSVRTSIGIDIILASSGSDIILVSSGRDIVRTSWSGMDIILTSWSGMEPSSSNWRVLPNPVDLLRSRLLRCRFGAVDVCAPAVDAVASVARQKNTFDLETIFIVLLGEKG